MISRTPSLTTTAGCPDRQSTSLLPRLTLIGQSADALLLMALHTLFALHALFELHALFALHARCQERLTGVSWQTCAYLRLDSSQNTPTATRAAAKQACLGHLWP